MLTITPDKLDKDKYYHCTCLEPPNNMWLSHGNVAVIYMGNNKKIGDHYLGGDKGHGNTLYNGYEWEVRNATPEEILWMEQSRRDGKVITKPVINYSIY